MRDYPDRMGELERRLRRDGIELARSKGGASSIAPAEGGQDDSVQRNHLACMGRAGWPGNASPGRCAPVEPTPRRRDRWGASHDGARRPGARGPARRLRRSDGDYWKPSSKAIRRTGPVRAGPVRAEADETRPWGALPGNRSESGAMRRGAPPISGTHQPRGQLFWRPYDGSRSRSLSSLQRPRLSSDRLTEQPLRELGASVPSQDIRPQVCWPLPRTRRGCHGDSP